MNGAVILFFNHCPSILADCGEKLGELGSKMHKVKEKQKTNDESKPEKKGKKKKLAQD